METTNRRSRVATVVGAIGLVVLLLLVMFVRDREPGRSDVDLDAYRHLLGDVAETSEGQRAEVGRVGVHVAEWSAGDLPEVLDRLVDLTERTHGELAAVSPPDVVADAHHDLERILLAKIDALQRAGAALEADEPEQVADALFTYADLVADWNRTHQLLAERLARDA